MNVNCNINSDLRSVKIRPILPDYLKKENVGENLVPEEEAEVQRSIEPNQPQVSITANAGDVLAMYNIGMVQGVNGGRPEAAPMCLAPKDGIIHDEGYDELVANWEANGENLCDKDKIKLLSLIINKTGNDETAKNMWCAIRFEITNNVYMTNINNLDEQDGFGYNRLMDYLQQVLDVIKGSDQISARKCTEDGNSTEQQLIGYKALLSEQEAVIAVCEKLIRSPHLRRKDYPIIQSRLAGATEKVHFYAEKIRELSGISVSSGDIGKPEIAQNEVK